MNCATEIALDNNTQQALFREEITSIANEVYKSRALDNNFYKLWMSQKLNAKQLEVFADNYYHWISPTVTRLAKTFVVTDDLVSRLEILHNIRDELGGGNLEDVHIFVLRRWLDGLLEKHTGHPFQNLDSSSTELLPTTLALTEQSLNLCSRNAACANGAILAQEWHAYTQFVKLYEGFRHYMDAYELDEFHDICEYLYIHIGWAEKEHKIQSIITAARSCKNADDFAELKYGFNGFISLLGDFWDELYTEIIKH
ncbi:iron-containing redox enzyme family protein [Xenorhabdus thailandensis]|uniref:iron-containing redox enzyme family protein n=1 Tax=Xenorhabdus thailandensis TaxID=3136255 RepID=UPI0030F3C60D